MTSPATSPDGSKTTSALWKEEGLKAELRDVQRQLTALEDVLEKTRIERDEQRSRAAELEAERERACHELDVAQQSAKRLEVELDALAHQHEALIVSAAKSKVEADEARKAQRVGELERERLEDALAKEREQVLVFECELEEMKKNFLAMSRGEEKQRKSARSSELERLQETIKAQGEEVERLRQLRAEERQASDDLLEQVARLRLTARPAGQDGGAREGGRRGSGEERGSGSEREGDETSSVGSSLPFTPRQPAGGGGGFRTKLNLAGLMGECGGVEATPRTSAAAEAALAALDDMEEELAGAAALAAERGEQVQALTARLRSEQRRNTALQRHLAHAARGAPPPDPEAVQAAAEAEAEAEAGTELERELAEARARVAELEEEGAAVTEEVERALAVLEAEAAAERGGRREAEAERDALAQELQRTRRTHAAAQGAGGGEEGLAAAMESIDWQLADLERAVGALRRRGLGAGGAWERAEGARLLQENAELANRCLHLISQSSAANARTKELERKGQGWSREVERLQKELRSLSDTLDARDSKVEELEQELEKANGRVDMMAAQMAAMQEYLYDHRTDPLEPAETSGPRYSFTSKASSREKELQAKLDAAMRSVAQLEEAAAKDREHSRSALVDFMRDFGSGSDSAAETQALQQEVLGLRALLREKEAVMEKFAARARGTKRHKDWWRRMF